MRTLYLLSVWLHVLAAATWVGGMVLFVVAVMPLARRLDDPHRSAFFTAFGDRLGALTWTSFAVLAVTGTFNLYARGVSLGDFMRPEWRATSFGTVLLVKLALVVLAVGICVVHLRVRSRLVAKHLGRLVLLLGLAIIGAAVMLVRNI